MVSGLRIESIQTPSLEDPTMESSKVESLSKTWNPGFLRIQSKCLNVLGAYLEADQNRGWNLLRSRLNVAMTWILFGTQIYAASTSTEDKKLLCLILGILVGATLSAIKMTSMLYLVDDFVSLKNGLTELSKDVTEHDREKLMKAHKIGQTISLANISCLLTSTLTLILYPLVKTIYEYIRTDQPESLIWPTPFDVKYWFDASYSPVYELLYVYMLYLFVVISFSINAADSMFIEVTLLLACHFEFLQRDIEALNYAVENLDEKFIKIYSYHRGILRTKDTLQRAYNGILPSFVIIGPTMFALFVISALFVSIAI